MVIRIANNSKGKGLQILIVILAGICAAGIVICLWLLVPSLMDYRHSAKDYQTLQEQVVSVQNIGEASENDADSWWYTDVSIDFDSLQAKNPDIIAWIRFDNLDQIGIDYPVVHTDNNDDYLHTDIYGNHRKSGTLFFEARIPDPLTSSHKKDIIYGHLMKDGSMFAPLKKYINDPSIYEDNQYFTVYKRGEAFRYRIFSYFITTAGSDVYTFGFTKPNEAYRAHIDMLKSHSMVHEFDPDYEHDVLTLSTCAAANSDQRIVVHGELIDKKKT